MRKTFFVAALLSLSVSAGAMAQQQQHGGTPEEQKACAHDVQKYCRAVMNDGPAIVLSAFQNVDLVSTARSVKAAGTVLGFP